MTPYDPIDPSNIDHLIEAAAILDASVFDVLKNLSLGGSTIAQIRVLLKRVHEEMKRRKIKSPNLFRWNRELEGFSDDTTVDEAWVEAKKPIPRVDRRHPDKGNPPLP